MIRMWDFWRWLFERLLEEGMIDQQGIVFYGMGTGTGDLDHCLRLAFPLSQDQIKEG